MQAFLFLWVVETDRGFPSTNHHSFAFFRPIGIHSNEDRNPEFLSFATSYLFICSIDGIVWQQIKPSILLY